MDPKPKKAERDSTSAGSASSGDVEPDVSRIVQEAESIARGEDPAAASNDAGAPQPGKDGDGTRAPAPDSPPVISDADRRIARRIVAATDKLFVRYFGPGAGFEEIERDIAIEDWSEISAHYMPKVLQGSPGLRLAVLYVGHVGLLLLGTEWLDDKPNPDPAFHRNGSSPATSDGADQERRTS